MPELISPEAYQRVFGIMPSDSNAMAFCQGCFAQMLESEDVYEAIRYFGKRNKIAFVHFRNVVGTVDHFAESYWDEGKIDMFRAMRAYHKVGYHGYMVPDHNPKGIGDTKWGHRARAFGLGYIRGLAHAVYGAS